MNDIDKKYPLPDTVKNKMAGEIRECMAAKGITRQKALQLAGYDTTPYNMSLMTKARAGDTSDKFMREILKAITEK